MTDPTHESNPALLAPPEVEPGSVALMYLTRGETRYEFTQSVLGAFNHDLEHDHHLRNVLGRIGSGNLAVHRNEVVSDFLNLTTCEWLWCVDDDIQLQPDTLYKLLESADTWDARVVCGLYANVGMSGDIIPMSYFINADNRIQNHSSAYIAEKLAATQKVIRVHGSGAGCLLVHRSVLEDCALKYGWPMPCFVNSVIEDTEGHPVVQGEDHGFFRRLFELDIPVILRLDVDLTHFKVIAITDQHIIQSAAASADSDTNQEIPT